MPSVSMHCTASINLRGSDLRHFHGSAGRSLFLLEARVIGGDALGGKRAIEIIRFCEVSLTESTALLVRYRGCGCFRIGHHLVVGFVELDPDLVLAGNAGLGGIVRTEDVPGAEGLSVPAFHSCMQVGAGEAFGVAQW